MKLTLILFCLTCLAVHTSYTQDSIMLVPAKDPKIPLIVTPYKSVLVLDSRIDTTKLVIYKNGKFPLDYARLYPSEAVAVQQYLQQRMDTLQKGNKELLVNILQLKGPSSFYAQRRMPGGGIRRVDLFQKMLLLAEVYEGDGSGYYRRRLMADDEAGIRKRPLDKAVALLLDELLKMTVKEGIRKNNKHYQLSADTNSYTLEQIHVNTLRRWK